MAYRLFGDKPLPEPMLTQFQCWRKDKSNVKDYDYLPCPLQGSFEIHRVRQYLIDVVLFGKKFKSKCTLVM